MKTFKVERNGGKSDVVKADTYMIENHVLNFYNNSLKDITASFPVGEWLSVIEVK